jgi:hypothetical protein
MYITASLYIDSVKLHDPKRKTTYTVDNGHRTAVGSSLMVVAGPHSDFTDDGVYTVQLLNAPLVTTHLPFFDSTIEGVFVYAHINVCNIMIARTTLSGTVK